MRTNKTIVIIGMLAMLAVSAITINAETILGCGCRTYGFSPITGMPCDDNVPGPASVPDSLPIGDVTDINASFWEQVSHVGMSGWASSSIHSTTNVKTDEWVIVTPQVNDVIDVEEVFGAIKTNQLVLSVLYPSDTINLWVGIYNKGGNNLFYGDVRAAINPPENGVSMNTLDIVLEMSPDNWIPFDGARRFEVIERDENNNPVRYYHSQVLDIRNGMIRFPNYFSRKGGEIVVTLCDGTQVAYSLNGGKRIIPTTVVMTVGNVSALGTRTSRDTNWLYLIVSQEESKRNINPTVQLFVPLSSGKMTLTALRPFVEDQTVVYEVASGFFVWPYGSSSSTAQWVTARPHGGATILLESGQCYWVKSEFSSGWPVGNQFHPPYQGGGGGGGGGSVTPTTVKEK